jgi:hypothetical protein
MLALNEDAKIFAEGFYTGTVEKVYEIECVDQSCDHFKWCKYVAGSQARDWSGNRRLAYGTNATALFLDDGVSVAWATDLGKEKGDRWTFIAYPYWSTPFSPVQFVQRNPPAPTSAASAELVVEGVYIGNTSYTYELQTQVDVLTFKWRRWVYGTKVTDCTAKMMGHVAGCPAAGNWSEPMPITKYPQELDEGVMVKWPVPEGKTHFDGWVFHAYKGHMITYYGASYVSEAVPGATNVAGDPRTPTVQGVYTGEATAVYTIMIDGYDCSTSCSTFKWKKNDEKYRPGLIVDHGEGEMTGFFTMETSPTGQEISDGIRIVWGPTTGWQRGNTFIITAKPMPTTINPALPIGNLPEGFHGTTVLPTSPYIKTWGTYNDNGDVPSHDTVYTIEFTATDKFVWRKDTGQFSDEVELSTYEHGESFAVGTHGLNLTFEKKRGYEYGEKYLIKCGTHIPIVQNVSTLQGSTRALPSLTQPVSAYANYLNYPNQGSLIGDILPYHDNTGNHSIKVVQTDGYHNAGTKGVGISNLVTSEPTPGYATTEFPVMYVKIAGDPEYQYITGELQNELFVDGSYTGSSSFVYEIEPYGNDYPHTGVTWSFRWRKWPKGLSALNATGWETDCNQNIAAETCRFRDNDLPDVAAQTIEKGITVKFKRTFYDKGHEEDRWNDETGVTVQEYISVYSWTFTAEKGHTFVFREAGKQDWSGPVEITQDSRGNNGYNGDGTYGGEVALSSGLSLRFERLSGYVKGDQFQIYNRTITTYGTYTGAEDAVYTVEILGAPSVDPVVMYRPPDSSTTGLAAHMEVTGDYTGNITYQYEIRITNADVSPTSFRWRKYPMGTKVMPMDAQQGWYTRTNYYQLAGGGPWSLPMQTSLGTTYLDEGMSVNWGAISGHTVGDFWAFTAHKGDTFRWRKDTGPWSWEQTISNIGLVEADLSNVGVGEANTDLKAMGYYSGDEDFTYVVEILQGGQSFRWKKDTYLPFAGTMDNFDGTYRGTEQVPWDGAYGWSTNINIVLGEIPLSAGMFIQFFKTTGWNHGDIFYIPMKGTKHHQLSDGLWLVMGSMSGYSVGDVWTFTANHAVPARGPLDGNTEVILTGTGFLPTEDLRCAFDDPITGYRMVVPGQYDSPTQIRCTTEAHPADTISAPEFIGLGNSALELGGYFVGKQTIDFVVEIDDDATFRYTVTPATSGGMYSQAYDIGSEWIELEEGIKVRFPGGPASYVVGDSWSFKANYIDFDNLNSHPEVELGTIKPGVMKHVYASNDAGVTWSKQGTAMTRFLFSDIYVSTSGDDTNGEGTWALPYRTIQRAIHAALAEPRSSFYYNSGITGQTYQGASTRGMGGQINRDSIVLLDGRYAGVGNTGLFPMGKMLVISAAHRGNVVIDCDMTTSGDIYNGDRFQAVATTGHATLRGINVDNCSNRFLPSM